MLKVGTEPSSIEMAKCLVLEDCESIFSATYLCLCKIGSYEFSFSGLAYDTSLSLT